MGEDFEAGVCGGNWWNPSRGGGFGSSLCNINDHIGSYGLWAGELVGMKVVGGGGGGGGARSSEDSSDGTNGGASGGDTMDSTLQMMGIGLSCSSSSTTDWNQFRGNAILQDQDLNYHQETALPVNNFDQSSTIEASQVNFPTSFGYPSTLLQTLFDDNSPPEQSVFDTGSMNYSSTTTDNSYRTSLNDQFSPSTLPKLSHMVKPKQQVSSGQLHLSNNTPFWNSSASALNDIRASFFTSAQSQFLPSTFEEKPNCTNLTAKSNHEEIRNTTSMKKGCSEPAFKRPRLETPSPLPTFKVRKEKLGDRITALQQLVSPFGKTDTASVLHEAIEYIKLLHDQVNVLSTPYMKNGESMQCQQNPEKAKETEGGAKQDLKTRGLCLVPVSSTFPVASETTADFWTPNFGGTFR